MIAQSQIEWSWAIMLAEPTGSKPCFSYTFIEEWHWANQTRQNCLYQGLGIEYSASQML